MSTLPRPLQAAFGPRRSTRHSMCVRIPSDRVWVLDGDTDNREHSRPLRVVERQRIDSPGSRCDGSDRPLSQPVLSRRLIRCARSVSSSARSTISSAARRITVPPGQQAIRWIAVLDPTPGYSVNAISSATYAERLNDRLSLNSTSPDKIHRPGFTPPVHLLINTFRTRRWSRCRATPDCQVPAHGFDTFSELQARFPPRFVSSSNQWHAADRAPPDRSRKRSAFRRSLGRPSKRSTVRMTTRIKSMFFHSLKPPML